LLNPLFNLKNKNYQENKKEIMTINIEETIEKTLRDPVPPDKDLKTDILVLESLE
jgi:hypothetical protein